MNQNKRSNSILCRWYEDAFPIVVAISYLAVAALGLYFRFFRDGKWCITDRDADVRYASSIDSEIITDWDNPLIQKISIIIKHTCCYVFGETVEGITIINCAVAFSLIFLAVFFAWLLFFLVKKSKLYALCLFPFSLFSFYPVPSYWSNSAFFVPLLILNFFSILLYHRLAVKWQRILMLIILFVELILLIDCRRNALFVIPVLIFWIMSDTAAFSVFFRGVAAVFVPLALYVFTTTGLGGLIDIKESHPTSSMLSSDMVMACCLEGRLDDYSNPYVLYPDDYPCCDRYQLRAFCWGLGVWYPPLAEDVNQEVENKYGKSWKEWGNFIEFYKKEWREHPKAMLVAKLIQCEQFYTGFYMPSFMKKIIMDSFPALRKHSPGALDLPYEPFYRIFLRLMTLLSMLVIPCFIYIKRKQKLRCSLVYETIFYSSIVAFLYACSFIIVTPMAVERYLLPSIIMATAIVPLFFITEYIDIIRNKNKSVESISLPK